jgi:hypothetical protein
MIAERVSGLRQNAPYRTTKLTSLPGT